MRKFYIDICRLFGATVVTFGMLSCAGSVSDNHVEDSQAHHHDEDGEIEITEKQMTTVGIELGHVEKREIGTGLMANGTLTVSPQDMAEISPMFAGLVSNICVVEGSYVQQGDVLAYIENMDITTYQHDYQLALEDLSLARSEKERQDKLAAEGAGIRKNLEMARVAYNSALSRSESLARRLKQIGISPEAVASGEITEAVALKSPVSGIISKIFAVRGSYADMSTPIMTVTDNRKIYAVLRIYEKDVDKVESGQRVDMSLTNGAMSIEGTVADINRSIDPETKGIDVKVVLDEINVANIIPGMAVTAFIRSGLAQTDALPEDAVIASGGKTVIYVLEDMHEEDGQNTYHFEPVEVIAGNRQNGYVEIKPVDDLDEDAVIVVKRAFYLASMAADHGEHNH